MRFFALCISLLALIGSWSLDLSAQLPDDFNDVLISDALPNVVGLTFDENGQMYIWSQSGEVHVYQNGQLLPTPLLDLSEEVSFYKDLGLLSVALDPDFLSNGYFYTYYVVDNHYLLNYGTPSYNPNTSRPQAATISRVTRYQADAASGFTTTVANSRKILLGETLDNAIPSTFESHQGGMLVFGNDGSLLVTTGDGADFTIYDVGGGESQYYTDEALQLGILRPQEDVGTWRCQMLDSYNGKLLRIDPETGDGLTSNPWYDPVNPRSPRSRSWSLGLRQGFGASLVPNSGSTNPTDGDPGVFIIGELGSWQWEEINVVTDPGMNFGWPLYEGWDENFQFVLKVTPNLDAPNPLYDGDDCDQEFFSFHDLLQSPSHDPPSRANPCDPSQLIPEEIEVFNMTLPTIAYRNFISQEVETYVAATDDNGQPVAVRMNDPKSPISGDPIKGAASLGGTFYTGNAYPAEYRNTFFHGDILGRWSNITIDSMGNISEIKAFADLNGAIRIAYNPADESLYYININPREVRKIQYGGQLPPVAVIAADTIYGSSPLTVAFDGSDSYDPVGEPITHAWDFGDGQSSNLTNPTHTFTATGSGPERFDVTLTVTDSAGVTGTSTKVISLNNTPPSAQISSIKDGDRYSIDAATLLNLEADVTDDEHTDSELAYGWQVFLHHSTHFHPDPIDTNRVTSVKVGTYGCRGEDYWYRVRLTVSDPAGLSSYDEVEIFPWCGGPLFDLLDFRAGSIGGAVNLSWTVRDEHNIIRYEVQRANESLQFSPVDSVLAQSTGSGTASYLSTDNEPLATESWYRLKAVNNLGGFEFSDALKVAPADERMARLYPNPFSDLLHISLEEMDETFELELIDMRGRSVFRQAWTGTGALEEDLDLSWLGAGMYYYRMSNGSFFYSGKLARQ